MYNFWLLLGIQVVSGFEKKLILFWFFHLVLDHLALTICEIEDKFGETRSFLKLYENFPNRNGFESRFIIDLS
jgi:hypothetical protein